MLNVPSENASVEPRRAEPIRPIQPPEPEPLQVKRPRVDLQDLGELADQVRSAYGEGVQLVEVDGELKVIHPMPADSRERSSVRFDTSSPLTGIVLAALIVAGAGFGWTQRKLFLGGEKKVSGYHPPTLEEAHKFLSKNSTDPLLTIANRPFKKSVPRPVPDLNFEQGNEKSKVGASTGTSKTPDLGFAPMPPPIQGQIGDALPDPRSPLAISSAKPVQASPSVDLHGLEAKFRICVSSGGGRITRVREGSNFKTFYVSVSNAKAHSLASKIESQMSGSASVSEPSNDESDAEGLDDVKVSEIKAAQAGVTALKKQMEQAEISFLPEAPALKSIRAQYAQALSELAALQKQAHPSSILRVTLSAN